MCVHTDKHALYVQVVGEGGSSIDGADKMEVDGSKRNLHVGTHAMGYRRDGMEVISPFEDGVFSDWDVVESLWTHALK